MSLSSLQNELQHFYEIDIAHSVNDFLISHIDILNKIENSNSSPSTREKLLIHEHKDELSLSLYLHQGIINNIDADKLELTNENVEDYCLALEGISHFLYLVWNASFDRSVTKLEMELQAEVDKFIMLNLNQQQHGKKINPASIRRLLFDSIHYHDHLNEEELMRYQDASKYAEKYCWQLELGRYLESGAEKELQRELRRFYRLDLDNKLRRINS